LNIPASRSLPAVLREQLEPSQLRVLIGKVVSVPDTRHVRVEIQGSQVTIPKLASYSAPAANEPCYVLADPYFTIALGTCK
jgi:hypothetical protein